MWCGMLCNGGAMWNGVTWKVVRCKIFWCDGMMCYVKTFNVVWSSVIWNAIWTLLITNTTAPVMWNVAGTHTDKHETNDTQLHAHGQSNQSPEEKRWVLRTELKDTTEDVYICYKVGCGMVCCMMWNVCGSWSGAEWCGKEQRMVAWNCGVAWNVMVWF